MKKFTPILREGEPSKRKISHKAIADVGGARGHFTVVKTKATKAENEWEVERKKLIKAEEYRDKADEELGVLQEVIDMDPLPEGAQPVKRIQQRDQIKFKKEQLDIAVIAQQSKLGHAWDRLRIAEKDLFAADKEMHLMVDQVDEATATLQAQKDLDHILSDRLAKHEHERALRWEKDNKKAISIRAEQMKNLHELATKQITNTQELNKEATERLDVQLNHTRVKSKDLRKHKDIKHDARTEQVLELKANQDLVAAGVKSAAVKHRTHVKAVNDELEIQKESMIAKGLNPYAVFRQREFDNKAKHRKHMLKKAVHENKALLAERLIKEEEDRRKEEAIELKARKYEKKHRDEQGRHVTEERNEDYIRSVTVGIRSCW